MPSVLRSISLAALLILAVFLGVGSLAYSPQAHADGTIPAGCTLLKGVIVCTDGAIGNQGNTCITVQNSPEISCIDSGGNITQGVQTLLGKGLGVIKGVPAQTTGTGWLSRITGWLSYALNTLFAAIAQLAKDLVTYVIGAVLGLVANAIASIQVPSWITNNSMGTLLSQAGPVAGFFMAKLQIPAALGIIGLGYAFRLLRKFLTLFQW